MSDTERKYNIVDVIDIITEFFPDEPCSYNGMDEHADCDWCEEHCTDHSTQECWQHAIENQWWKRKSIYEP